MVVGWLVFDGVGGGVGGAVVVVVLLSAMASVVGDGCW